MTDLLQWYNQAEAEGTMSPIELASLFHYRYIRIHPFEDGNGRISRLIVNYILYRHGYPMIVVRTKDKKNYLAALSKCDAVVGKIPSDGAQASLEQTKPFVDYMTGVLCKDISTNIAIIKDKDRSIWWYNGELITFKSQNTINLLDALNEDGKITVRDLADKLGINKSAVQKQLKTLQDKGYIIRVGGRSGYWKVIIVCTTPDSGTK